jgi:hypothetical protein
MAELPRRKRKKSEDLTEKFVGRPRSSCLRCRKMKRGCDGNFPCKRCVQKGCASECRSDDGNNNKRLKTSSSEEEEVVRGSSSSTSTSIIMSRLHVLDIPPEVQFTEVVDEFIREHPLTDTQVHDWMMNHYLLWSAYSSMLWRCLPEKKYLEVRDRYAHQALKIANEEEAKVITKQTGTMEIFRVHELEFRSVVSLPFLNAIMF